MECTLVVIVFTFNAGKVINTRREVVEAVLLMHTCPILRHNEIHGTSQ